MPVDDRALVAALVAGDPDGLRGAYRAYVDRVYTLCYRLLGDAATAADACHDAFVVASQRAYRLRDPDGLPAWLLALARNECLRRLRGAARRAAAAQPDPALDGLQPDPALDGLLPAPELLWPRLELYCFDPDVAPEREAIVRKAGRLERASGFPPLWHARRRRRLAVAGVAALVVLVLATAAGMAVRPGGPASALGAASGATGPPSPGRSPSPSPEPASPSPSPSPTQSPPPNSPPPPPAPRSAPRPSSASPATLAVEATGEFGCVVGGLFGYQLEVNASASQRLDAAELHVVADGGAEVYEMAVDGRAASATSELLGSAELEWWVEVTGTAGEPGETAPTEVSAPCAG